MARRSAGRSAFHDFLPWRFSDVWPYSPSMRQACKRPRSGHEQPCESDEFRASGYVYETIEFKIEPAVDSAA
jgi:hypothetical protein